MTAGIGGARRWRGYAGGSRRARLRGAGTGAVAVGSGCKRRSRCLPSVRRASASRFVDREADGHLCTQQTSEQPLPHLAERLHSSDGETAWNNGLGREAAIGLETANVA